jgi:hypothetical protein
MRTHTAACGHICSGMLTHTCSGMLTHTYAMREMLEERVRDQVGLVYMCRILLDMSICSSTN